MENLAEGLDTIHKTLERQNEIMREIAAAMPKPASKFSVTLETIVLIMSIFGVISVADIIVKWIRGG